MFERWTPTSASPPVQGYLLRQRGGAPGMCSGGSTPTQDLVANHGRSLIVPPASSHGYPHQRVAGHTTLPTRQVSCDESSALKYFFYLTQVSVIYNCHYIIVII